jgi:hypothetical protein
MKSRYIFIGLAIIFLFFFFTKDEHIDNSANIQLQKQIDSLMVVLDSNKIRIQMLQTEYDSLIKKEDSAIVKIKKQNERITNIKHSDNVNDDSLFMFFSGFDTKAIQSK